MPKQAPTSERFVAVWQASRNAGEAAKRLGMSLPAVYKRSTRLRAMGVNLKYFLPRIDVARMNELCRERA
jgi:hypothetical protein